MNATQQSYSYTEAIETANDIITKEHLSCKDKGIVMKVCRIIASCRNSHEVSVARNYLMLVYRTVKLESSSRMVLDSQLHIKTIECRVR